MTSLKNTARRTDVIHHATRRDVADLTPGEVGIRALSIFGRSSVAFRLAGVWQERSLRFMQCLQGSVADVADAGAAFFGCVLLTASPRSRSAIALASVRCRSRGC